jgi:hypothetical protein
MDELSTGLSTGFVGKYQKESDGVVQDYSDSVLNQPSSGCIFLVPSHVNSRNGKPSFGFAWYRVSQL